MRDFDYHRPATLAEALDLLAGDDEALLLAGGQTLLPTMKQGLSAPSALVDLHGIAGLDAISVVGQVLSLGSMARHADVAGNALVRQAIPALAGLAGGIGDPHIRNRGTIGGSIANNDPSADYPAALLACGAEIQTDRRRLCADEFLAGLFTTALEPGEIILAVHFPIPRRFAYASIRNPASRYAVAGVAVAQRQDSTVGVGVTGAGADGAFRWAEAEAALQDGFHPATLDGLVVDPDLLLSDLRMPQDYRARLVEVMTRRAVEAALRGTK
ncbi:MAG: xanthine dehydrogenase family protein subunit M [Paracoccaceae bacterium]